VRWPTKVSRLEPCSIAVCIWRVNETGPSENVYGQYFAAPSRSSPTSDGRCRSLVIAAANRRDAT
jgi:hypothetical protein